MSKRNSIVNHDSTPPDFYNQIINSLEEYAVLTTDTQLMINSWNTGAKNIFQYEEEILGKHISVLFTDQDIEDHVPFRQTEVAFKENKAKDERWHIRKDNSLFFASGLVFPLNNASGEPIGFVKVLRDITEKKETQEAISRYTNDLKELNLHKDKTLSVLSHDLRAPLASISGAAQLLQTISESLGDPEVTEMADILCQLSKNMLTMLDNLLEWARVKYAADIFSPTKVYLNEFVKEAFGINKQKADIKSINLVNQIGSDVVVFTDEKMLRSILQNLISNAVTFTGVRGEIVTSAHRVGNMIVIAVQDNGIGMSHEVQKKLFIPQIESLSEPRDNHESAGIGLLLVKEFLDKIGGEIWTKTEEGKGSTFFFTIPLSNYQM